MGKHYKQIEKELQELRDSSKVSQKIRRNELKDKILTSFKNLRIVSDEKNLEKAERFILSNFQYERSLSFNQLFIQVFIEKYIDHFDLIIEQTPLWKKINH